jgi:hypothetical protein
LGGGKGKGKGKGKEKEKEKEKEKGREKGWPGDRLTLALEIASWPWMEMDGDEDLGGGSTTWRVRCGGMRKAEGSSGRGVEGNGGELLELSFIGDAADPGIDCVGIGVDLGRR